MNQTTPDFANDTSWTLLFQGAEARVWKSIPSNGNETLMIAKERFSKAYRHATLDARLTQQRCRAEAKLLQKCYDRGICVPRVLRVEPSVLYLEYLQGQVTVREALQQLLRDRDVPKDSLNTTTAATTTTNDFLDTFARRLGETIAELHELGIVHGDLTTSNMMVLDLNHPTANVTAPTDYSNNESVDTTTQPLPLQITLIDFGLAKHAASAEERAVDLYVLERALQSTHPTLPLGFFDTVLRAYGITTTLTRLEQVRQRGRKRDLFG
jgi:TP53 regulating kinase-like protein